MEEIEEAREITEKCYYEDVSEKAAYEAWLAWENKVIENHYDDIVKIEEEEE